MCEEGAQRVAAPSPLCPHHPLLQMVLLALLLEAAMLATPSEPPANNSPFFNWKVSPSGYQAVGRGGQLWAESSGGRELPGLWVAGEWVTCAEDNLHQHRRAGATAGVPGGAPCCPSRQLSEAPHPHPTGSFPPIHSSS